MRRLETKGGYRVPIVEGTAAPRFTLFDAGGERSWSIEEAISDGPVVLGVYKSSCRASKIALPFLERLYQSYPKDKMTVWGIALDSPTVTSSFARRYDITLPILIDSEGYPTSQALEVSETPTIFLIDESGAIVWKAAGFDKPAFTELSEAIAERIGVPPVDITSGTDDVPSHEHG